MHWCLFSIFPIHPMLTLTIFEYGSNCTPFTTDTVLSFCLSANLREFLYFVFVHLQSTLSKHSHAYDMCTYTFVVLFLSFFFLQLSDPGFGQAQRIVGVNFTVQENFTYYIISNYYWSLLIPFCNMFVFTVLLSSLVTCFTRLYIPYGLRNC